MKHGRDCPSPTCSQCLGVEPRRVVQDGQDLLIDGKPAGRGLDKGVQTHYQRRGGKR